MAYNNRNISIYPCKPCKFQSDHRINIQGVWKLVNFTINHLPLDWVITLLQIPPRTPSTPLFLDVDLVTQIWICTVCTEMLFCTWYIFLIREILLISRNDTSRRYIILKKSLCPSKKNPDTLMTVDPKTRLPSMCPSKKVLGQLCHKTRRHYKNILRSLPLKDSPRTKPVRSWEDNLQKGKLFVIKNHCVSAEPNRPTYGCRTHKRTSGLIFFW